MRPSASPNSKNLKKSPKLTRTQTRDRHPRVPFDTLGVPIDTSQVPIGTNYGHGLRVPGFR